MNKYHKLLNDIMLFGEAQSNKKGNIKFLTNQSLTLYPDDLLGIFEDHRTLARRKLKDELDLYMRGETRIEEYRKKGIMWWDYLGDGFRNSYPDYFKRLPELIERINRERRNSKNYVFFNGETNAGTNQLPCISLIQFQIISGKLHMTVYQRSADCSLGLPSDIYQAWLISRMIDIPLDNITFFIGNAHIYENNVEATEAMLRGGEYKYMLNV